MTTTAKDELAKGWCYGLVEVLLTYAWMTAENYRISGEPVSAFRFKTEA
jgi:hypothetical protein